MKKSFLMFGVAAMALASCTQNEVVEYADSRAIQFDTFVNNNTRAGITEIGSTEELTEYYVYGYHSNDVPVFENVKVTSSGVEKSAYWQQGKIYNFAAYSDGNAELISGVGFDAESNTLTISNYTPNNSKDLVAAVANELTCSDPQTQGEVGLSFKHMLSQVKFTFNNDNSRSYTMKISDIKISDAIKTGTGTLVGNSVATWSGDLTGEGVEAYSFDGLDDIAEDGTHSTACLVIPQNNADLKVTFTATFWDEGSSETQPIKKGQFVASLKYDNSDSVTGTETSKWTAGFRYNYTVTINGDDINDTQNPGTLYPIEFDVTEVSGWGDASQSTAPSAVTE